jgi:hypothetical protein
MANVRTFDQVFWSQLNSIGVVANNPCRTCISNTAAEEVHKKLANSSQIPSNKSHIKHFSASLTSALINPIETAFQSQAHSSRPTLQISLLCPDCAGTGRSTSNSSVILNYSDETVNNQIEKLDYSFSPQSRALAAQLASERGKLVETPVKNSISGRKELAPLLRSEKFARNFFNSLFFQARGISSLDYSLTFFNNLVELHLTGNNLTEIKFLPPNLQVLNCYANRIEKIALQQDHVPPLQFLGLAYNHLTSLADFLPFSSSLTALDLSYNHVANLSETVAQLEKLPELVHFSLTGNPITLCKHYKPSILSVASNLDEFDSLTLKTAEQRIISSAESRPATAASGNKGLARENLTRGSSRGSNSHGRRSSLFSRAVTVTSPLNNPNNLGKVHRKALKPEELAQEIGRLQLAERELELKQREERLVLEENNFSLQQAVNAVELSLQITALSNLPEPGRHSRDKDLEGEENSGKSKKSVKGTELSSGKKKKLDPSIENNSVELISEWIEPGTRNFIRKVERKSQKISFFIEFRMTNSDSVVYRTQELECKETPCSSRNNNSSIGAVSNLLNFNYTQSWQFPLPTVELRDLFFLMGLDFFLYQRRVETLHTDITTTKLPANAGPSTPSSAKMKGKSKQNAEIGSERSVSSHSSEKSERILLGFSHLDCKKLLETPQNRGFNVQHSVQTMKFTQPNQRAGFLYDKQRIIHENHFSNAENAGAIDASQSSTAFEKRADSESSEAVATAAAEPTSRLAQLPPYDISPARVAAESSFTLEFYLNCAPIMGSTAEQLATQLQQPDSSNKSGISPRARARGEGRNSISNPATANSPSAPTE